MKPHNEEILLRLHWERDHVSEADIISTRPQAVQVLTGKTPDQVKQLVPLLFSLCGGAQSVAANAAIKAAEGEHVEGQEKNGWSFVVTREAATEHLWRLLLDWPQACGFSPYQEEYAIARRGCMQAGSASQLQAELQQVMENVVLGMPAANWLGQPLYQMLEWMDSSQYFAAELLRQLNPVKYVGEAQVRCLPMLAAMDWGLIYQDVVKPGFPLFPTWKGSTCETGALVRQLHHCFVEELLKQGSRVAARVMARLVELAYWAGEGDEHNPLVVSNARGGDGVGLSWVETARGVLLHRAKLAGGRVLEYTIVAPTEWNFHPHGAFASEVIGMHAASLDIVERNAKWLALSLDPCVSFGIEVVYA